MAHDRVGRLIDYYFNRPQKEYLFLLSSMKRSGDLTPEEISSIHRRIPFVHASAIIRQMTATTVR